MSDAQADPPIAGDDPEGLEEEMDDGGPKVMSMDATFLSAKKTEAEALKTQAAAEQDANNPDAPPPTGEEGATGPPSKDGDSDTFHPPINYKTLADENIITDPEQRPESLVKLFRYIDDHETTFVKNLREAVGIQSISAWPSARIECYRMVEYAVGKLKDLGFEVELKKIGTKPFHGAEDLQLPPIILATRGNDSNKKTLLVYGHLDVQPASKTDGWGCEPFYLTEEGNCLYGRGASDDKGPVLGWFHAIEAYMKTGLRPPVNVKMILESMEECGSDGLDELLSSCLKDTFLSDVDAIVMSDNYWLGKEKPCLTYGLRGLCYFFVEVECGEKDLHSGVYGGVVMEAMPDLIWLMNQLTGPDGTILVPGVLESVCPVVPEEEELYKTIDFNLQEFQEDAGFKGLRFPGNKIAGLMNRWRFPALTIHGIQGAFDRPGAKVVIPRKVIGKFSIRLVPNQNPKTVEEQVKAYMKAKWEERQSPNKMLVYMADEGLRPVCQNPFHPSFKAARQAVAWTWGQIPDMIREGGSLTKVLTFLQTTGKSIVLLPMGACDDRAHNVNEKIDRINYINGTKVFAAYMHELGKTELGPGSEKGRQSKSQQEQDQEPEPDQQED